MNKLPNAIVIGGDHHNTLGVIRSLGECDVRTDLLLVSCEKRSFVDGSKYVDRCIVIREHKEIVDCLIKNFVESEYKPVIICCSDASSGQIDEHYDILSHYFLIPGGLQQGSIISLMNKRQMSELATSVGLSIPLSFYISNSTSLGNIKLPCIFKPIESRKGTKSEIQIVRTKDELERYFFNSDLTRFQIQEFIDKDFEFQLIGCSTHDDVIIPGVSLILRPCKGSNTSFLKYIPLEENFCDIEKCKDFVKRTGYQGLFSIEFIRDKKGRDYFMEINFRNDGNAICVTAAGVNLPYIWYLDRLGIEYKHEVNKCVTPVYVMPDMAELKLLLTRQISVYQYLKDLRKTNRFMEYDSLDKRPFWKLLRKQFHF